MYRNVMEALVIGKQTDVLDLERQGFHGTALHVAAFLGHSPIVQLLLVGGADVNAIGGPNKATPLIHAVCKGQTAVIELLLNQNNIQPNAIDKDHYSALHRAAERAQTEQSSRVLERLIQTSALDLTISLQSMPTYQATPLIIAARHGNDRMVSMLLEYGANYRLSDAHYGYTPLHYAAAQMRVNIAKMLLSAGASPAIQDLQGNNPLHLALTSTLSQCSIDIIKLLIASGSGLNAYNNLGRAPLHCALEHNRDYDVVLTLLNGGCDPNRKIANVAESIRSNVTDPDTLKHGQTPLHLATRIGDTKLLKLLLDHGADCHLRDGFGRTPLQLFFVFAGESDVTKFGEISKLLATGQLNISERTPAGETALHFVNSAASVKFLLKLCPDFPINCQSFKDGSTALHSAVKRGKIEVVQLLLRAGADVSVYDYGGFTALERARNWPDPEMTAVVQKYISQR